MWLPGLPARSTRLLWTEKSAPQSGVLVLIVANDSGILSTWF